MVFHFLKYNTEVILMTMLVLLNPGNPKHIAALRYLSGIAGSQKGFHGNPVLREG